MQNKKKPIKVVYGAVRKLAADCNVSEQTVYLALRWTSDSPAQNLVRKRATELNLVSRF